MLRAKGIKPLWMQVMLVFCWILGEFAGGFVAGVIHVIRNGENAPMGFGVYALAIGGAVLGAAFTFLVAYFLPNRDVQPQIIPDEDPFNYRPRDLNNPYAP
jgi:hypothetical protein